MFRQQRELITVFCKVAAQRNALEIHCFRFYLQKMWIKKKKQKSLHAQGTVLYLRKNIIFFVSKIRILICLVIRVEKDLRDKIASSVLLSGPYEEF